MSTSNELRVFISSTFRDLQEEREHLMKKIFPEIRALCREQGVRFTEVDLRWGLTEEDVALGQVIRTCLEEVDRCRPYFIGITGDRYGYIPTFVEIQKDGALLEQYPWIEDAAMEGTSITEMEAQYAVLRRKTSDAEAHDQSRFYFRRLRASFDSDPSDDDERMRLEAYQGRIRSSGARIEQFRDPVSLGELIYDDLIELVKRDFANAQPPSPLEEERARHSAFALSRRRAYIANPTYLTRLNQHVESDDAPLVVYAESGSGKSSLFAHWAEQYRRKNPDAQVIEHYVGIGATATDHYAVIRHICMEIKERFAREDEVPKTPDELGVAFGQWLGYADHSLRQTNLRMVLILDGLNQLQGTALNLRWIPDVIPPSIRLIVSSTVEGSLVTLKSRGWNQFGMQSLTESEREAIVVRYLSDYHKSLNQQQIKRIAEDYKCGHPLFLKTLLEELRLVGRHEELDERINDYLAATGTEDLFQHVLERMEDDFSLRPMRDVMTLLWASRGGLDERELADITGLSRLKIASMTAGLDYHLVRKDGYLTFFHDYLRRAVQKRYVPDEVHAHKAHLRIAEYFRTTELDQRSGWETVWGYTQAKKPAEVEQLLGDLDVLRMLYTGPGEFEVLTILSRLREAGRDVEALYRGGLARENPGPDHATYVNSLLVAADVLERLGLWTGGIEMARRASDVAVEANSLVDVAAAERALGWLLHLRGDNTAAITSLKHAAHLYDELGDQRGIADATLNLGTIYRVCGEYGPALECCQRALSIADDVGDRLIAANAERNIGLVFFDRGEYDRALEHYYRTLKTVEELGNQFYLGIILFNIGSALLARREGRAALEYYQRSLAISERLGDRVGVALGHLHIGQTYSLAGNYETAMDLFNQSLKIVEDLGALNLTVPIILNIAALYDEVGDYDSAMEQMQRALSINEHLGDRRAELVSMARLGALYVARGEREQGLDCFDRALMGLRELGLREFVSEVLEFRARVLLSESGQATMPSYLANRFPDADHLAWPTFAISAARNDAEESLEIARSIHMRERIFTTRVLLERIDAAEGNADHAVQELSNILNDLPAAVDDNVAGVFEVESQRAELNFWIWKLGESDNRDNHRIEALNLFSKLVARTPKNEFKLRIAELATEV